MSTETPGSAHPLVTPGTHPAVAAAAAPPPASPVLLGHGMAQEMVSLAAAMAVQDAGNYFRQVSAVSAAAVAVFTAKMAENATTDPTGQPWLTLIQGVASNMTVSSGVLKQVGTDAASVISAFGPTGAQ
jgi:hypothetical protein